MSAGKKHGPMGGPMGRGPMAAGQKAKNFKGSFRKLAQYLAPFKWKILIVGIFAIASTVFAIIGPNILKDATNELVRGITATITGAGDGIDFGLIGFIVLELAALYAVSSLFSYIQGYVMAGVSAKMSYQLRRDISHKINRLPLDYFNRTSHGEVLSRITNDVDTLNQGLNQPLPAADLGNDIDRRNGHDVFHQLAADACGAVHDPADAGVCADRGEGLAEAFYRSAEISRHGERAR